MKMKRVMKSIVFFVTLAAAAGTAFATEIAVVDTEKLFSQSEPGKLGQAHLEEVQKVLQKGFDELLALYRARKTRPRRGTRSRKGERRWNVRWRWSERRRCSRS